MRSLAVANGVPADAITLETRARNTYENVAYSHEIAGRHGWKRMLLVSSPYHMRRALMTWHKVAPDTRSRRDTRDGQPVLRCTSGEPRSSRCAGIAQEYAAIVLYWWRGWV